MEQASLNQLVAEPSKTAQILAEFVRKLGFNKLADQAEKNIVNEHNRSSNQGQEINPTV